MKLATIAPIPELDALCGTEDFHLVLYHLLQDEKYKEFYKERAKGYIILDNGAYEGQFPDMEELIRMARYIGAAEIVLPDELLKRDSTIVKAGLALAHLHDYPEASDFKYMLVPQGGSVNEWALCLKDLLEMYHEVFGATSSPVIGLSKVYDTHFEGGRASLIERIPIGLELHLLGYSQGQKLLQVLARYPYVRSLDTARAVVYALRGLGLSGRTTVKRPSNYFQLTLSDRQRAKAIENVWTLKADLEALTAGGVVS